MMEDRRWARLINASGYDGRDFRGAKTARLLDGRRSPGVEYYVLLLDDGERGEDIVAGGSGNLKLLDVQPFWVSSSTGPCIVYSRSLSGTASKLLDDVRSYSADDVDAIGSQWGPFSADAQLARTLVTFGFRVRIDRGPEAVELVGMLLDLDDAQASAAEYVGRLCRSCHAEPGQVEIYDTGWSRPERRLVVFRSDKAG